MVLELERWAQAWVSPHMIAQMIAEFDGIRLLCRGMRDRRKSNTICAETTHVQYALH